MASRLAVELSYPVADRLPASAIRVYAAAPADRSGSMLNTAQRPRKPQGGEPIATQAPKIEGAAPPTTTSEIKIRIPVKPAGGRSWRRSRADSRSAPDSASPDAETGSGDGSTAPSAEPQPARRTGASRVGRSAERETCRQPVLNGTTRRNANITWIPVPATRSSLSNSIVLRSSRSAAVSSRPSAAALV